MFSDATIYESFFQSTQHPAIIVDLNVNTLKAFPTIYNPAANALKSYLGCDIFSESHLDNFNGTFEKFLSVARKKVEEEIAHTDILHLRVKSGAESSDAIFSFSTASFNFSGEKMLGILLMEISKTVKEELDALDTFKSSLISALSHELNNPMNSLMLLLNMMPSCYSEGKKEDLKEMALASANILHNKIRDLIDFATIGMDSIKITQTEFFVDDLFEKLTQMFRYEAEMKMNELVTRISSNNKRLAILGDRNRIEQVLVKLVTNANKYTNKGRITVSAIESKMNFNVIFTVTDTGVGIPEFKRNQLFDSLKQKATHPDAITRLPGLGLNIAQSICKCMDAVLNVVSQEGAGTKFSFEIPVCRIATFEKPLVKLEGGNKKVSYPLFPIRNRVSRESTLNFIVEEERKKILGKETPLLNSAIISPGRPNDDMLHQTDMTRSSKLKKDASRIFGKFKLSTMATFRNPRLKDPDTDILEEGIQVHEVIPRYQSFMRRTSHSESKSLGETGTCTRRGTVLIVDDVYSNRMVIREIMKKMRVPTNEAINGRKAVDLVEASFHRESTVDIALILMDLNMPLMTGIEASMEIRRLEKTQRRQTSIPIVAVTAHDAVYGRDECIKAGMQDCAAKPVASRTLRQIVKTYAPKLLSSGRGQSTIKM